MRSKISLTCLLLRQFTLETFEVPPPFTSQSMPKESGVTETTLQIFLLPPSSAVPSPLQFLSSWHLWRGTKVKIADYQPTIEITSQMGSTLREQFHSNLKLAKL